VRPPISLAPSASHGGRHETGGANSAPDTLSAGTGLTSVVRDNVTFSLLATLSRRRSVCALALALAACLLAARSPPPCLLPAGGRPHTRCVPLAGLQRALIATGGQVSACRAARPVLPRPTTR